jgi:RNA polymerase-associated protein
LEGREVAAGSAGLGRFKREQRLSSRRSAMTLYSAANDPGSQRARIVLAEKGIAIDIISVDPAHLPEDLLDLNSYHSLPTLIDRDLVLYDSRVIIEYLDERYPHPPLLPVDPVGRARSRLAMFSIEKDWYAIAARIDSETDRKELPRLRKELRELILQNVDLFRIKRFFLSDEFSLVDATIAPILWRLPHYGIDLPSQAEPLLKYAALVFSRPAFRRSLTETEQEMRPV